MSLLVLLKSDRDGVFAHALLKSQKQQEGPRNLHGYSHVGYEAENKRNGCLGAVLGTVCDQGGCEGKPKLLRPQ